MKTKAGPIALCGLLAALAAAGMCLGTLIPIATFCCPMFASFLLIAAADLCGKRFGVCWWIVTATLSLLLAPDKEAALLFLLLGYYPLLKPQIDKLPGRLLRCVLKLSLFAAVCGILLWLLSLLGLDTVFEEFGDSRFVTLLIAIFFLLAAAAFLAYDSILNRIELLWRRKWKQKLLRTK